MDTYMGERCATCGRPAVHGFSHNGGAVLWYCRDHAWGWHRQQDDEASAEPPSLEDRVAALEERMARLEVRDG